MPGVQFGNTATPQGSLADIDQLRLVGDDQSEVAVPPPVLMAIGRTVMTASPLVSTRRRSDGHLRRLDQRQTFRAERKWLAVGRSTFATHRANLTGPPRPGIPLEVEGDERVIGFAMLAS